MKIKKFLKRSQMLRTFVERYRLYLRMPSKQSIVGESATVRLPFHGNKSPTTDVLFATSGGGNLAAINLESILSTALSLRGARVQVLMCDGQLPACFLCTIDRYPNERKFSESGPDKSYCKDCFSRGAALYEALNIKVIKYSDLLTCEDRETARLIAEQVREDDIKALIINGVAIGEHALAGALRFYATAALSDKFAPLVLKRYVEASMLTAAVMDRYLASNKCDCIVVDHGIYVPNGIIGECARKHHTRVVNWHVAYRKNCFIFSHNDTYHHTLMTEPISNWLEMPWSQRCDDDITKYLDSRWNGLNDWIKFNQAPREDAVQITAELDLDASRPIIGMLTNVMWDAQLHYPANAFEGMLEWVIATIRYFETRNDMQLVIRIHPAEVVGTLPSRQPLINEINSQFASLPANVKIVAPENTISSYALMHLCNAALIYGTKMGVELSSVGIPTIVAGEAWIRNKGVTFDASTKDEYLAYLDRLPFASRLDQQVVDRARKYAYHFFMRRMIPLDCVREYSGSPPFSPIVRNLSDLFEGSDKGLDVICNGILTGSEFIYPSELYLSTT
jgi:hypothetical protein